MSRTIKDAIVICLDVGLGMQNHHPNVTSPLQNGIDFISMLIQRKIFAESKDKLALVLFGSDDTANELSEDGSYSNINVAFQMGVPDFNLLTYVSHNLESGTVSTDFLDALTVCLDIMYRETSSDKKIGSRKIILVSNLDHDINDDGIDGIMNGFKAENMNVQLHVVGTDFHADDLNGNNHDENMPSTSRETHDRNNFNLKPKSSQQQKSEEILKSVFKYGIEGACYSFAEGIKAVTGFEKRSVNSAAWKCNLTLGKELSICCVAYAKCKEAKLKKNWKKCHSKTMKESDIKRDVYHFIDDEDETEVMKEEIGKGFKYGKDIIPFGKVDTEEMKYLTEGKKLTILGFTDQRYVSVELFMDDQAHFLLPDNDDSAASTALSSMVLALNNQGFCAIACYVYRKGSGPKIVALIPRVKSDYQCFVMVALPFSEDIRPLTFPSLEVSEDKVREEQLNCVGNFIDAMSLEQSDEEEDDLYEPRNMLNPYFQQVFQCLHHRSQHENDTDLPPVSNTVQEILAPSSEIVRNAEPITKEMTKLFKLEIITEKKMKKAWKHKSSQELSTDNGDSKHVKLDNDDTTLASITSTNRFSIGTLSPIQDFERILRSDFNTIECFRLFQAIIKELVSDSFSSSLTEKIIDCLKALIQQAEKHSMSYSVNNFLNEIKLQSKDINSSLWNAMVENNINLINASLEERKSFCSSEEKKEVEEEENMEEDGAADDLLDMMD